MLCRNTSDSCSTEKFNACLKTWTLTSSISGLSNRKYVNVQKTGKEDSMQMLQVFNFILHIFIYLFRSFFFSSFFFSSPLQFTQVNRGLQVRAVRDSNDWFYEFSTNKYTGSKIRCEECT
jgi:hypothetical protein